MSRMAMTIVGLVLTGAMGWFVLNTMFWLLGWNRHREIDAGGRQGSPGKRPVEGDEGRDR